MACTIADRRAGMGRQGRAELAAVLGSGQRFVTPGDVANRLQVDIDYRAESGRRGSRRVEPYSLRRTVDGNLLLFVVNDRGQLRGYRVDRIAGARPTEETFRPRFLVELSVRVKVAVPCPGISVGNLRRRADFARPSGGVGPVFPWRRESIRHAGRDLGCSFLGGVLVDHGRSR